MPGAPLDTEKERLRKIAQGDEAAFAKLFALYSDWVYATSLRLTKSTSLTEEVVQDVFLKIWLRRGLLVSIESFPDYLFIIARNHSFTAMKRALRLQQITQQPSEINELADNTTDLSILYKDYQTLLQVAVSRLPPRQNEVYRLVREEGCRKEEAAKILGISPNTVKIHLKEALRSIRAYFMAHTDVPGMILLLVSIFQK